MGFESREDMPKTARKEESGTNFLVLLAVMIFSVIILTTGNPDLLDALIKRVGGY